MLRKGITLVRVPASSPLFEQGVLTMRNAVLRPTQSLSDCHYPGDSDPLTAHFALVSPADSVVPSSDAKGGNTRDTKNSPGSNSNSNNNNRKNDGRSNGKSGNTSSNGDADGRDRVSLSAVAEGGVRFGGGTPFQDTVCLGVASVFPCRIEAPAGYDRTLFFPEDIGEIARGGENSENIDNSEGSDGGGGGAHFRIRGMAVCGSLRGTGLGKRLLGACTRHMDTHGGALGWCNSRTTAAGFYAGEGFVSVGPEFDIDPIGPHFLLVRHPPKERDAHPMPTEAEVFFNN